ncbi:DUF6920 family protein [Planococcus sp. CAU13]|uniref:DUF6920 family protein n=1 Tax=Planococcus sp. CAU13 TaxID=1541197 RepID=UPI0006895B01|nr:DUF6544 family protein [Planococcus sp. CAU13]
MIEKTSYDKPSAPGIQPETEAVTMESLPPVVRNWLYATGAVGHDPIRCVRLKQTGTMKLKPEQKDWTSSESEQICFPDSPAFHCNIKMKMGKGLFVTSQDRFAKGKGSMCIKLAGIVPISTVMENAKIDQSALQRYLMELGWYPSAALNPYISWEEVDDLTATATIKHAGLSGSATFYFDGHFDLVKVEAWRYKDSDENARPLLCTVTVTETQWVDALRIPVAIDITWQLEDGPFTWYRFKVHYIRFNVL